ncbi:MAG: DUF2752 domain-containing protein [Acidimicrobiales bacterium]
MMVQAGRDTTASQQQFQGVSTALIQPAGRDLEFRMLGGAMAVGGAALSVLPALGPLCPLRRVTGVPCPFCGMTTATLALARGDVGAAVAANPMALILIAVVAIAFVPPLWRMIASIEPPERLRAAAPKLPWILLAPLWLLQLHRFDFI